MTESAGDAKGPEHRPADDGEKGTLVARLHEHALVQQGMRILRSEAARLARRLGGAIAKDEIEELGHVALVQIVRGFDPGRGPFAPYATRKLRWALLDELRRASHGRVASARATTLACVARCRAAVTSEAANPAAHEPRAEPMPDPLQGLRRALRQRAGTIAVALVASSGDLADAVDPLASPEQLVARRQAAGQLWAAVRRLPEPQRQLVERHYAGGEPFGCIAADLGLSKGWASRLHAQAVRSLAQSLLTAPESR